MKSTPLYLDPFYTFPKRNVEEEETRIQEAKHFRMSSLDSVRKRCEELIPACKDRIEEIKHVQTMKKHEGKRINDYMDDFADCLKMSKDKKTFEDSMSTRIYNRKLDSEFTQEIDTLRENMLEVTKNAIDYGGQKIWRWKNKLFLANTDKLINSVPSNRK
jgi:hypothetical protein